jgi:hypothetical protein
MFFWKDVGKTLPLWCCKIYDHELDTTYWPVVLTYTNIRTYKLSLNEFIQLTFNRLLVHCKVTSTIPSWWSDKTRHYESLYFFSLYKPLCYFSPSS